MKSYTTLRNLYGSDTKNTSSANLSYGDQVMNDFHRRLLAKADWPFLHQPRYLTTLAPTATVTVVAGTDVFTATDNTILTETGTEVVFSTTTTLPAGISASTTYYMIYQSATTFKVATSLANAYAGTAVDVTDTGTGTHTASVSTLFQPLPYDVDLVESVSVKVGTTTYNPTPVSSRKKFDELQWTQQTNDSVEHWFVQDGKIAFWPRPATDGNVATLTAKLRVPDLNIADYTTGNIDIAPNGSILITGAGAPGWTTPMVGRWIRITHSNTASSSGDGEWYRITSVPSSTTLTIARPYGGRSLTTGAAAAYIIGQMPLLPEAFHDLPEMYGAHRYWMKEKDSTRAKSFETLLKDGVSTLFTTYGFNDMSMVLDSGDDQYVENPNLFINL